MPAYFITNFSATTKNLISNKSCLPYQLIMSSRAPKQWVLTKTETVNSFESWKQNLGYILSLDNNFAPFLDPNVTWQKKTRNNTSRGFTDDPQTIPEERRRTVLQKVTHLELMLGQIANYCPVISRNTIIKSSTSIASIWQSIRAHYGFQSTGSHFLDLSEFKLEVEERPEDLYQRLTAFFEDSLLTNDCGLSHHGETATDEDMSPTLENTIVLIWLQLIHRDLPRLVKQRYGTELRSRTLASIKPEISQALDSLLDELHTANDGRVMRMSAGRQQNNSSHPRKSYQQRGNHRSSHNNQINRDSRRPRPVCPICKEARYPKTDHFLSNCPYLPEKDRRFIAKTNNVIALDEEEYYESDEFEGDDSHHLSDPNNNVIDSITTSVKRVQMKESPIFHAFYKHLPIPITLDTGAETNLIKESVATRLGLKISPSSQYATQADGSSQLTIIGETKFHIHRNGREFYTEALVARNIDADVLAGIPFMAFNDITIRPAKKEIIFSDGSIHNYNSPSNTHNILNNIRRTTVLPIRASSDTTTVWPGEYIEVTDPQSKTDCTLAVEPRIDSPYNIRAGDTIWPAPIITQSIAGKIRIPNHTDQPIIVKKNEHIAQVSLVYTPTLDETASVIKKSTTNRQEIVAHSTTVTIDPDNMLQSNIITSFKDLNRKFSRVFEPNLPGYNGAVGPLCAVVNMGPVLPPQRKGKLPQYARNRLEELQAQIDDLEDLGVFGKPEDLGVIAEYINPSFLVKKENGGNRLVTNFTEVGKYAKPQPSLMPNVDSTLREIAKWKYIIKTDLTKAYYQIPLSRESMKYCGVATPFRGIRVYKRCAMGMPGSETALEELMSRILGDLIFSGNVTKIADDLYCGADSLDELLKIWESILHALDQCDLRLSPTKTVICPKSTIILGWKWSQGTLSATKHKISTLSSVAPPTNVKGLRSFIGAYKVLARVVKGCSDILAPLEHIVAGKPSTDKIEWTNELHESFSKAKNKLLATEVITLPKPSDQLWIVTDGAVRDPGIGATMYVTRETGKPKLAGFFSAKLKKHQPTWLPCEIEALSIATAVKHYGPYITQSKHRTSVLTDSKPCVQAYEKLSRGSYSNSARVTTFLSTASEYHVNIRHLKGSENLPSDFASRNAPECDHPNCQICRFIDTLENAVVNSINIKDILDGTKRLPFTNRPAWLSTQANCPDICRTISQLKQGTRPTKKSTNIKDVKRYLRSCSLSRDGLLVVRKEQPFEATTECIVVPRNVLAGLLTALHIQLDHPTPHQLKKVFIRHFFALDLDKYIDITFNSCHQCASIKQLPSTPVEQSTTEPPSCVGVNFSADVIRRTRQFILLLRETVTSFTSACIIQDEKADSLMGGLLQLILPLHPVDSPHATIRTDPCPGFQAIVNDNRLESFNVSLELGEAKNINKNPVAEKAVQEVEREILRQDPSGNPISSLSLAAAVSRLNTRIRGNGLSSHEMWYQREQFSNTQISISDDQLIRSQNERRVKSHHTNLRTNARIPLKPVINVGDIVYLRADVSKVKSRSRYIVTQVLDSIYCNVQKFNENQFRSKTYKVRLSDCFIATDYNLTDQSRKYLSKLDTCSDSESDYEYEEKTTIAEPPPVPPEISSDPSSPQEQGTTRKGKRPRKRPGYLEDYECSSS